MTGNKNLVLIGMPGSGKSTVGVLCAKALGMPFLDTDLAIQQKTGKLLQKSVDELGAEGFLVMEVLATGGSVALEDNAMAHLRERGVVFYLSLPYKEIERRLRNIATRGIAMGPGESLKTLYDYRVPHYEKWADVVIEGCGQTLEETVQAVVSAWRAMN